MASWRLESLRAILGSGYEIMRGETALRIAFQIVWVLISLVVRPLASQATDYTWVGASSLFGVYRWTSSDNWSPQGVPGGGDTATFNSYNTHSCTVLTDVSVGALTVSSGYTGIITASPGQLTVGVLRVADGTLTPLTSQSNISAASVTIEGGLVVSLQATGDVLFNGGTLANLILAGDGILAGSDGAIIGAIQQESGIRLQQNIFEVASLQITGGTYTVGHLKILACGPVTVGENGALSLERGSALISASNITIQGTVDARQEAIAITCAGDWRCPGRFLRSGSITSQLVLAQLTGGQVNHGDNWADNVIIKGASEKNTLWTSANTIISMQILPSTTLQLNNGAVLSVTGVLANLGTIVEVSPAHLHISATMTVEVDGDILAQAVTVGEGLMAWLWDQDENVNGTVDDLVQVQFHNPRNGDVLKAPLEETAVATGLFSNQGQAVMTAYGEDAQADNLLQVIGGDTVEVLYQDAEDSLDTAQASIPVAGTAEATPTETSTVIETPPLQPTSAGSITPEVVTPSPTPRNADLNSDGKIDAQDLLIFMHEWRIRDN